MFEENLNFIILHAEKHKYVTQQGSLVKRLI